MVRRRHRLKATKYRHDVRGLRGVAARLVSSVPATRPLHRLRVGLEFALSGHRDVDAMIEQHSALARALAERLGLDDATQQAVTAAYEGGTAAAGPAAPRASRSRSRLASASWPSTSRSPIGSAASPPPWHWRATGPADSSTRGWSSRPGWRGDHRVRRPRRNADLEDRDRSGADTASPSRGRRGGPALEAVADFVDLKSPYTLGHSRGVADLAARAGRELRLPVEEVAPFTAPALVHDLGRLGVSNAIWDKPGPLGSGEWERVRMYPYLTERMLCQSSVLAPARRDRGPAPRAVGRVGIPTRTDRRVVVHDGAHAGRG